MYIKQHNKWWDGYNGEKVVLLDDLDAKDGPWIGKFLKLWGDHYPFPAEIKGSHLGLIRPESIIVTSNWPMNEVFTEPNVLKPLERRFQVIHKVPPPPIVFGKRPNPFAKPRTEAPDEPARPAQVIGPVSAKLEYRSHSSESFN